MFKKVFAYDGWFIDFLRRTGELIIISVIFLLCCIPVVTIGSSVTSLYYTVIKCIRRERGNTVQEYFASMKRTMVNGILATVMILIWFAALYFGYWMAIGRETELWTAISIIYLIIAAISLGIVSYLFPVMSRFTMKLGNMWKLAFVMSIRFLPFTILIVAGHVLIVFALFYTLPMACVAFVPGVWCFIITFMMEKALLAYMPEPEEGEEEAWYYIGRKTDKQKSEDDAERGSDEEL